MASQEVFRLMLGALSRPAVPLACDFGGLFAAPPPMPATLAALALTLADMTTPVWLSPSLAGALGWLVFHRSVRTVADPGDAALVLAAAQNELPDLRSLDPGTPRHPDRSATVLLGGPPPDARAAVSPSGGGNGDGMSAESDAPLLASGPGLKEPILWSGHGLGRKFLDQWEENRLAYPQGVDVFLAGERTLAGLPRTLGLRRRDRDFRRAEGPA
jgi:alpha-D-ribose 1-methylphosphonate 5-triphosphate synthase subunit PhnH